MQKDADPRSHFTATVMGVLGHIHGATLSTTPHTEKLDDSPSEEDKEGHRQRIDEKILEEMNKGVDKI
jgi:hypothetical protein